MELYSFSVFRLYTIFVQNVCQYNVKSVHESVLNWCNFLYILQICLYFVLSKFSFPSYFLRVSAKSLSIYVRVFSLALL